MSYQYETEYHVGYISRELHLDASTIRRYLRSGKLRGTKHFGGGMWWVKERDLQAWLAERYGDSVTLVGHRFQGVSKPRAF